MRSLIPLLLVATLALPAQDDPRAFRAMDVVNTRSVTTVEVSSDGRQVLFVRTRPRLADDPAGGDYRELYILDLPQKVAASGPADPTWSRQVVQNPDAFRIRDRSDVDWIFVRLANLSRRRVMVSRALGLAMSSLHLLPEEEESPRSLPTNLPRILDRMCADMTALFFSDDDPRRVIWVEGDGRIEFRLAGEDSRPFGAPEPRGLITGKGSVSSPHFTPDGSFVSFLGRTDDAPHTEVCIVPVGGGKPSRLTTTSHGVSSYAWSHDGSMIAYTTRDPMPQQRSRARAAGFRAEVLEEDLRHPSLWVWDRRTGASRRLTSGMSVWSFAWSEDGSRIAFGAAPDPSVDARYMKTRLHHVDLETGTIEAFTPNLGKLGAYAWSPDGQQLAYIGAMNKRDPHAGVLWVTTPDGEPRALTAEVKGQVHDLVWLSNDRMLVSMSIGVHTHLAHVWPGTGEISRLPGGGVVAARNFSRSPGGRVFGAGSTGSVPPEVYELTPAGPERLTWSNSWLADRDLGMQEVVRYSARDGMVIEGLLIHPPESKKTGGPQPMVIVAHGGPESHYSDAWVTRYSEPGQLLAARGMYVWYPNYRASTGYGVAFAMADHGDPMGGQFRDHLDAIDHLVKRGIVDREKVGVIGGSYGGYTAAYAATRETEAFAAAVSFVPFTDMTSKWWTSDIPVEFFLVHYREMWPDEQRELMDDRSPVTWAKQCKTPLLLAGGTADPRVHPSQPHMLWRKVKLLTDTPVRYVRYPGEGHGNRQNVYRFDYLVRGARWLEHYLTKGRSAPLPPIDLDLSDWYRSGS